MNIEFKVSQLQLRSTTIKKAIHATKKVFSCEFLHLEYSVQNVWVTKNIYLVFKYDIYVICDSVTGSYKSLNIITPYIEF